MCYTAFNLLVVLEMTEILYLITNQCAILIPYSSLLQSVWLRYTYEAIFFLANAVNTYTLLARQS